MNRNEAAAVAVAAALILALLPPAFAQTPATPQPPPGGASAPTAPSEPQSPNGTPRDASGDADARHCLDLATNPEIIACAEKYRSHRMRK